jgi:hypothetical protein
MDHINLWFAWFNFINYDTKKHYQFNVSVYKTVPVFNTRITKPTQITYEEYKQLKEIQGKPSTLINSGGMTFPKKCLI